MIIPWDGVPLASVLKQFKPTSKAKYVAFKTVYRPAEMPGQRSRSLDWPYVEGLRIDEAMHPLSLLAVGLYGKTLPNQNGAPLRLVTPWKYGFKGIKSIVEINFTEKQPPTSWNISAPHEYGFYANVNPKVDHPRWSQARERKIGAGLFGTRGRCCSTPCIHFEHDPAGTLQHPRRTSKQRLVHRHTLGIGEESHRWLPVTNTPVQLHSFPICNVGGIRGQHTGSFPFDGCKRGPVPELDNCTR